MIRQGLGKGLGMGYKNIVPFDSHVHSLSARGVKTYKLIDNQLIIYNKGQLVENASEEGNECKYCIHKGKCDRKDKVRKGVYCDFMKVKYPEKLDAKGTPHCKSCGKEMVKSAYAKGYYTCPDPLCLSTGKAFKENELNAMAVRKADFYRPLILNGKELTHIIFYDKNGMLLDSGHGWLEDEKGRDIEQMDVPDNLPVKRKEDFTEKYGFLIAEPQDSFDRKYKTHKAKLYLPFKDDEWTFSIKLEDWYPTYSSEYKVWKNDKTGAVIRQHLRNIPKEKNVKYQKQMEELSGLMGKDNPSAHTLDQNKPEIKKKIKQMAKDIDAGLYAKANPKTRVDIVVQGNYGSGWEDVTAEEKWTEARQRLKEYNENEPNPHRIITRRVKINQQ